jgi:hypothetical protein
MISCTDFIPLYSELFKYIEDKEGYDAVTRYWQYISKEYVEPRLGELVKEKGIEGCWDYWTKALNEEAADFTITYDEDEQVFEIDMHYCPSKGSFKSTDAYGILPRLLWALCPSICPFTERIRSGVGRGLL